MLSMIPRFLRSRAALFASDAIETLKLPARGTLSHTLDIPGGIAEVALEEVLAGFILRDDRPAINGLDRVISANSWPEIYRYVVADGKVETVIVEISYSGASIKSAYARLERRLQQEFGYTLHAHRSRGGNYTSYTWTFASHQYYLQVLNDRVANLNPVLIDYDRFGHELDGTFVLQANKRFACLPSIAAVFGRRKELVGASVLFLVEDCQHRAQSLSLMNMPALVDLG